MLHCHAWLSICDSQRDDILQSDILKSGRISMAYVLTQEYSGRTSQLSSREFRPGRCLKAGSQLKLFLLAYILSDNNMSHPMIIGGAAPPMEESTDAVGSGAPRLGARKSEDLLTVVHGLADQQCTRPRACNIAVHGPLPTYVYHHVPLAWSGVQLQ